MMILIAEEMFILLFYFNFFILMETSKIEPDIKRKGNHNFHMPKQD